MKKFLPLVALLMSMIVSSCNKSNGVESLPEQEQPEPHLESVNFIPQNNSEQVIVDATENISSAVAQFQFQLTDQSEIPVGIEKSNAKIVAKRNIKKGISATPRN